MGEAEGEAIDDRGVTVSRAARGDTDRQTDRLFPTEPPTTTIEKTQPAGVVARPARVAVHRTALRSTGLRAVRVRGPGPRPGVDGRGVD